MGHEASGVITELGPKATQKGLKLGDRVTYYYNQHCGNCYYCRNGQEHFCSNLKTVTNAMSEYIVTREQSVYKLPSNVGLKKGALVEPISVCLHGIDLIQMMPGATVAISGGGTMGMLLTQLAIRSGAANLTVFEPMESKRNVLLKLGAQYAIDPFQEDRKEASMRITENRGFDVVIEASGTVGACRELDKLVARGGTLEFFAAMYPHNYNFPLNLLDSFMKEIHIVGGVFQSPYTFPRSIALAGVLNLETLLTDNCVFQPEDYNEAFEKQISGDTIKSLIQFSKE